MDDLHQKIRPKFYSLSELSRSLSMQIQKTYSGKYWIVAEISKLNYYPQSGHCYPQLVEKKSGKIVADMKGFILRQTFQKIKALFNSVTGKELGDGMQILFQCTLGFHAVFGFSLNILEIEPSFTLGEMARMRQEAIKKLKEEDLFEKNKQLFLPLLVQNIAVISVETSKGFLDFTNVLASSPFPESIKTRLFPALLQGDAAVESIISALIKIRESGIHFDAVAIIRGGGGETGLDCYDHYKLGREVSLFTIPVLTGIGHASNLTVVEQVAYKNLITPTDLARNLVQNFIDFGIRIEKAKRSLSQFKKGWFKVTAKELDSQIQRFILEVNERLNSEKKNIRHSANRINVGVETALREANVSVKYRLPLRLESGVKTSLENQNRKLSFLAPEITRLCSDQISDASRNLGFLSDKLRILDPANTLKRGFSITTINGKPITDASQAEKGAELETRFWKGSVKSTIK